MHSIDSRETCVHRTSEDLICQKEEIQCNK